MATIESIHNTKKVRQKEASSELFCRATKSNQKGLYQRIGICFPNKIWVRRVAFAREFLKKVAQTFCYVIVTTSKRVTELGIGANIDCGKVFHLALLSSAIFNENMIVFCEISLKKEEKIGVYTLAIYALNTKMKFCKNFLQLFFWRRRRFQSTPLEWEMMSSLLFSWFVRLEDDVLMLLGCGCPKNMAWDSAGKHGENANSSIYNVMSIFEF